MPEDLYVPCDNDDFTELLSVRTDETRSRRTSSGSGSRSRSMDDPDPMTRSAMTAADYFKMLNIETAKIISIVLVISFGVYHGILNLTYGVTPCKGLFLDGVYKEGGDGLWQPWGCMMHKYTNTDAERCFRYNGFYREENHFVFIGDSRIRQIYYTFQNFLMNGDFKTNQNASHEDQSWSSGALNLKLDFVWAPYANQSMIQALNRWKSNENSASVFVLGSATHYIKSSNNSPDALEQYTKDLANLRPMLESLTRRGKTKVLWMLQPQVNTQHLHQARSAITTQAISDYNAEAKDVFSSLPGSKVILWTSLSSLSEANLEKMEDGLHMPLFVLKQAVMMLLNQHCNEKMNFNDGSCCKKSDQPTSLQIITFTVFIACALILLLKFLYKQTCSIYTLVPTIKPKSGLLQNGKDSSSKLRSTSLSSNSGVAKAIKEIDNAEALLFALVKMGMILTYFYVCDRTNFFMKENKYFTHLNFWLPVMYILIVGLFFNEGAKQSTLLHRQQTDEWKGWMQLVILIYHMTGGSKSLPIYMLIRVLVSAYLFINGYGHFIYAWKEVRDTSAKNSDFQKVIIRFFTVLFRMNFLSVLLCLAMNRPYQLYYFVPLISFWFAVQYVVQLLPPQVNAQTSESQPMQYLYIVVKVVALVSVISVLYMSEVFFEKVFVTRPWKALFVTTDDDIRAWWFRWKIDRYSSVFGLMFGLMCGLGHRYRLYDDTCSEGLLWSRGTSVVVVVASIVGLGGYSLFAALCTSKSDCTEIHPYVVFVPIVSFVMMRNTFGWLRSRYSSFFAWFGRISLELFLAQYHIWLAADADGVLVLIPNYPVMNILLTSFIFVCASHEIHNITEIVLPYLAPKNARSIIRNVIIFIGILVPIGIHDGMF